jgi:hypothetical protein
MTPEPSYYKICSRLDCDNAGAPQDANNFYPRKGSKDGLRCECKPCSKKGVKYNAGTRVYMRGWRERNRDKFNAYHRGLNRLHPRVNRQDTFTRYGVTREWYEATLSSQGGVCAICGRDAVASKTKFRFHIDHDHDCCKKERTACDQCRRGLLCFVCNTRLSLVEGEWLTKAVAYLSHFRKPLSVQATALADTPDATRNGDKA